MGGSYRQCTKCGKRALSIATRCPGCGLELPAPVARKVPSLDLRRFLSPSVVGGTIATTVFLAAAMLARSGRPLEERPSYVAVDSISTVSEVAYTTAAAARLDTTVTPLAAMSAGEVLVARTWTNVRESRSKRADVAAVLLPGDTVLADSLERGWYRVALDGDVLGYVQRSTLTRP